MAYSLVRQYMKFHSIDLQHPVEKEYSSIVTPYALLFIVRQLSLKDKVVVVAESNNCYQVSSSAGMVLFLFGYYFTCIFIGVINVTISHCDYKFRNTTQLPCRHIFAIRERSGLPLFCSDLVAKRWRKDYMKLAFYTKQVTVNEDSFEVTFFLHVVNFFF